MRLKAVRLQNFRSYSDSGWIDIGSLTALIGENDIGKSSILEALDAFFNDTIDVFDRRVSCANADEVVVSCRFDNLPAEITIDATAPTTLAEEFLLNSEGDLEISKFWRFTATKAELARVSAHAHALCGGEVEELLHKKLADLRLLIEQRDLEADRRSLGSMRRSIYTDMLEKAEVEQRERDVILEKPRATPDELGDSRKLWRKLQSRHLPVFSLFKSEQVRGDKESTVRSPLDATLKLALQGLDRELEDIAQRVDQAVRAVTERTLERLNRDYPDINEKLTPNYKRPSWSKAFDLDVLRGEDGVPLNKRGAGIRRLVVLAFFQAEAEKKKADRADGAEGPSVIYAVEEPETSQHPKYQKHILQALQDLSEAGDQVILTTHVPNLAELLPTKSVRFIDRPNGGGQPRVRSGETDRSVLIEAANSLGVLASSQPTEGANIAVWVEGDSDVWVLESLARKLHQAGELPGPLDPNRIFWIFGGGGDQLKSVVNGEYLAALKLPQFYLRDSDRANAAAPEKNLPSEVTQRVSDWTDTGIGLPIKVVQTRKREIENYLHVDAVKRSLGVGFDIFEEAAIADPDFTKLSKPDTPFWQALIARKNRDGFRIPEANRRGVAIDHRKPKHVICGLFLCEMTPAEFRQRCVATDASGHGPEIDVWFTDMAGLIDQARA